MTTSKTTRPRTPRRPPDPRLKRKPQRAGDVILECPSCGTSTPNGDVCTECAGG